ADTDGVVLQWDDPEPSILRKMNGNAARHVALGPALDAAEVAIYRRRVVVLVGPLVAQPIGQERVATRGVEHETWGEDVRTAVLMTTGYPRAPAISTVPRQDHIHDAHAIHRARAIASRMCEQRRIELRPPHVVAMGQGRVDPGREIEIHALAGLVGDEFGTG